MIRPDFDWNILFEPFPYRRKYRKVVKLFLSASDKDELGEWVDCVKSLHLYPKHVEIVREWIQKVAYHHALPKRYHWFASGTILTYGSYGLGFQVKSLSKRECTFNNTTLRLTFAHNLESDIDALCVRLCFARSEEDFFIILHNSREPTRSNRYPLCQRFL